MQLPQGFTTRVIDVHGEQGQAWLDELPDLIRELEQAWNIQVEGAFPDSNYNFVAPALRPDGGYAVLKLSVPGEHLYNEAKALEVYGGKGTPYLQRQDLDRGALLMDRVRPGTDISGLSDRQAVAAIVEVMEQLHQAPLPDGQLPTVREWGAGFERLRKMFDGETGPLPGNLVRKAEEMFNDLASSMGPPVLLHGDLHHMNVLESGEHNWLAIDPHAVIGESAYEIGASLRNPMPTLLNWPDLQNRQRQRIIEFSERTGFPEDRIAGWGFSQAVLSAIWSLEDHGDGWEVAIQIAKVLGNLAFA